MISISMLTGPNGLLNKSAEAKIQNDKGAIKDQVETEVMGSYDKRGNIDWDLLENNLEKNLGVDKENILPTDGENKENGITFGVEKNGREYTVEVDKDGKVTVTDGGQSSEGGSSPSDTEPPTITSFKADKNVLTAKVKDNIGVKWYCFNQSEEVRENEWIQVDEPHTEEKEYTLTVNKDR